MTHADLVKCAAKWLAKKHSVVITEMSSGAIEEPDALGFRHGFTTLVECKASRADFHADRQKGERRMGDWRYYMTPVGLIDADDIPDGWGLLYANGRGVQVIRAVDESVGTNEKDLRGEQTLLVSCLRRIGAAAPEGVSVKCYTMQTKCRATLTIVD